MPFIIEVQDRETGKTKYVTGGEWSDYSLDERVAAAKHFETRGEVNAAFQSPDFVRWRRAATVANAHRQFHGWDWTFATQSPRVVGDILCTK